MPADLSLTPDAPSASGEFGSRWFYALAPKEQCRYRAIEKEICKRPETAFPIFYEQNLPPEQRGKCLIRLRASAVGDNLYHGEVNQIMLGRLMCEAVPYAQPYVDHEQIITSKILDYYSIVILHAIQGRGWPIKQVFSRSTLQVLGARWAVCGAAFATVVGSVIGTTNQPFGDCDSVISIVHAITGL